MKRNTERRAREEERRWSRASFGCGFILFERRASGEVEGVVVDITVDSLVEDLKWWLSNGRNSGLCNIKYNQRLSIK